MPRLRAMAATVLAGLLAAVPALAQETLQLAAGSLRIEAGNRLVAEGDVEALWRDTRLRAARLVFQPGLGGQPDRLQIAGPIVLEDGDRILVLADAAELSSDLRDGLMTGVRLVLDRRLQLAARELSRESGRFNRLERAVASSCRICAERPVPLWEIRAARISHDAEKRRLTFERAAFRLGGRTVAVLPRLTLPDPSVRRATGFLAPDVLSSSALGPGFRLPYFIVLGPDRDLRLTPRLHVRGSYTLAARYRQAFAAGPVEIEAALTRDRLRPGMTRGYFAATADLELARGTQFGLQLELPSDARYRGDYGLGDEDIRENTVFLLRRGRDRLDRLRLTQFRAFRDGVDNSELPNLLLDGAVLRRFVPPGLGGMAEVSVEGLATARRSNDAITGAGRDSARLTARLAWRRDWLLPGGVQAAALADLQADRWWVRQDDNLPPRITRLSPALGMELRWPLLRSAPGGATQLLEPVAQIVWAPDRITAAPNEDSRLVEFDEVTLFSLHRFTGRDAREPGLRANLGLSWTRQDPSGWSLALAAGRVLRLRPADFSPASGLGGRRSDWLAVMRLETAGGLRLDGRAVIDDDGRIGRQELLLTYAGDGVSIGGSLVHLLADPAEERPDRSTELGLDGSLALGANWTALADLRYDVARREPGRAGLGARFRNECLAVDVSLSRRFVSSTSVAARTEFGLRVDLIGFGDRQPGPARPCAR